MFYSASVQVRPCVRATTACPCAPRYICMCVCGASTSGEALMKMTVSAWLQGRHPPGGSPPCEADHHRRPRVHAPLRRRHAPLRPVAENQRPRAPPPAGRRTHSLTRARGPQPGTSCAPCPLHSDFEHNLTSRCVLRPAACCVLPSAFACKHRVAAQNIRGHPSLRRPSGPQPLVHAHAELPSTCGGCS